MEFVYGLLASNVPFPVEMKMRPPGLDPVGLPESAARPAPLIQIPAPIPFAVAHQTLVCLQVDALYAKIQPCHGPLSPCAPNATYKMPSRSSKPARWFSHLGSQSSVPPELPFPFPATRPDKATGPPNFSLPVVTSRACSRCTYVPLSFVFPTT